MKPSVTMCEIQYLGEVLTLLVKSEKIFKFCKTETPSGYKAYKEIMYNVIQNLKQEILVHNMNRKSDS